MTRPAADWVLCRGDEGDRELNRPPLTEDELRRVAYRVREALAKGS